MSKQNKSKLKIKDTTKEKSKRGRKKKIDDDLIKKLSDALVSGASHKIACEAAGISQSSFYRWIKKAENGEEDYFPFLESIKGAESTGALKHLENIEKHSMNDWRASAWLLERRYKYTKEGVLEERPKLEEKQEIDQSILEPIELLKKQYIELNKAAQNALAIGSFQAYSALKRQELKVAFEFIFSFLAVDKLSTTMTVCPSSINLSTRLLPMNPAPPVTKHFITFLLYICILNLLNPLLDQLILYSISWYNLKHYLL